MANQLMAEVTVVVRYHLAVMSARSAMSMRMYFSNFFSISANRIHARPRPDDVRTFRRQRPMSAAQKKSGGPFVPWLLRSLPVGAWSEVVRAYL